MTNRKFAILMMMAVGCCVPVGAQPGPFTPLMFTSANPDGTACSSSSPLKYYTTTNTLYGCSSAVYTSMGGSGGGGAVIAGTTSQITVTGAACAAGTGGTCTLSLPSGLLIPGTINRLTLTAPATGATFTLIDGKTFTVNKSLTFDGADSTTMTFPATNATMARTDAANTFTGHQTIEGVTATGATGTGAMVYSISPAFTVSPTAPTQTAADNSTKLATTAYADAAALASTPKWSSIIAPTANLSIAHAAFSTTFTYNAATGSINGFKLTDTTNNTGSGILAYFSTASGSSMLPWQGDVNGVGFKIHTDGSFKSVGATTNGTVTLSGITSGSCSITVPNTSGSLVPASAGECDLGSSSVPFKGLSLSSVPAKLNNVSTVGLGVPSIYGSGRSTAQTAAVTSVATYTAGAADGSYLISSNVNVTTSTTFSINVQVTYTDETNTAQTLTLNFQSLAGTLLTAITNVQGTGPYEGLPVHIRVKASTAITIKTTGTFTSVTYNVEGYISQIG